MRKDTTMRPTFGDRVTWVRRIERIASAPDGDGVAVCVLDTATAYRLSEFGALIWEHLTEERISIAALVEHLVPAVDVESGGLEPALLDALQRLAASELIELG